MRPEFRQCLWIWLALMLLLTLTAGSAYVSMGVWNSVVNLVIAIVKAGLVAAFFMHLRGGSALVRIFAAVGLFTLALLFLISASDYLTRGMYGAGWEIPKATQPPAMRR